MAFKRSTVRSRPSPPKPEKRFSFLCFLFYVSFSKGIEPTVHLARFASAEREGHTIGDLRSKCKGLAPSIPSVSTKAEKRFSFLCFLFYVSFSKGIEPTVHLARFASAEREGHTIGDLRSKCEGLAPSIPSVLPNPQTAVNKGLRSFL